jgi:hypothetical protein
LARKARLPAGSAGAGAWLWEVGVDCAGQGVAEVDFFLSLSALRHHSPAEHGYFRRIREGDHQHEQSSGDQDLHEGG